MHGQARWCSCTARSGPRHAGRSSVSVARRSVDVLEVTVSGYTDKAANGELTLMIGGEARLVDRCDPYLAAVGDKRFLLGPVGAGSIAKLSNNVMAILGKLATFEGLQVAQANGVDVDQMVEVAMVSTGNSDGLRQWKAQGLSHRAGAGVLADRAAGGSPDPHDRRSRQLRAGRWTFQSLPP